MSWTVVRGHRPVGVLDREVADQAAAVGEVVQPCSCGKALYDPAHIAALVTD